MPVEIFCCYARKDQPLLHELKIHLMPLQRQGIITLWADTDIDAGVQWEEEIEKHLNTAQIILLLVSPDFIASEYCYRKEMTRAMERHTAGEAEVIPIILRSVLWENMPFGKLQALPTGAKPVISSAWHNPDAALYDVAFGIQKVVQKFQHVGKGQSDEPEVDEATLFEMKAIPTGFEDLDRLTGGGLQLSDLILVEAPPVTGKTSFALSIVLNVAIRQERSIGIFSLEMSKERLVQRLLSMDTSIEMQRLVTGALEDEEWENLIYAMGVISEGRIFIEDSADLTLNQLRERALELVKKSNVGIIMIDYVNLIKPEARQNDSENKAQDYREVSRYLKVMARELNIPVVALVQMSRVVKGGYAGGKRVLEARDSSIENDADIVMYIYREDMVNEYTERRNLVDLIVTKHRNGLLGEVSFYAHPRTGRFRDLQKNYEVN